MPWLMAASSENPVQICWPFLPTTVAVPVSWHMGNTPAEAMEILVQAGTPEFKKCLPYLK